MTTTEILLIAMFATFLVFALVIFCAFMALKGTMEETIAYMKNYTELITELYQKSHKYEESLSEDLMRYAEQRDHQNRIYDKFLEISVEMCEHYKKHEAAYKKLLDCWKGIDERYDQTFEQFKFTADEMKKIQDRFDKMPDPVYEMTLDQAIDKVCVNCTESACQAYGCPIYEIKYRDHDVDGVEGESPPDPEAMKEFYETNGFEDIRKKAEAS